MYLVFQYHILFRYMYRIYIMYVFTILYNDLYTYIVVYIYIHIYICPYHMPNAGRFYTHSKHSMFQSMSFHLGFAGDEGWGQRHLGRTRNDSWKGDKSGGLRKSYTILVARLWSLVIWFLTWGWEIAVCLGEFTTLWMNVAVKCHRFCFTPNYNYPMCVLQVAQSNITATPSPLDPRSVQENNMLESHYPCPDWTCVVFGTETNRNSCWRVERIFQKL